jgi:hypothetical protein
MQAGMCVHIRVNVCMYECRVVEFNGLFSLLCLCVPASDFVDILVTSAAEVPGIIFTALLIDRLGRRWMQALEFLVLSLTFWFIIVFDPSHVCPCAHPCVFVSVLVC